MKCAAPPSSQAQATASCLGATGCGFFIERLFAVFIPSVIADARIAPNSSSGKPKGLFMFFYLTFLACFSYSAGSASRLFIYCRGFIRCCICIIRLCLCCTSSCASALLRRVHCPVNRVFRLRVRLRLYARPRRHGAARIMAGTAPHLLLWQEKRNLYTKYK